MGHNSRKQRAAIFALILAPFLLTSAAKAQASVASRPARPPALTAADADAFFGGIVPFGLSQYDIAGAAVAIVRDGHVLFEKGYGYSDLATKSPINPQTTMFRPGSVSKLFVWTSVMQLVEQGKIDLDADINQYLDFRIPSKWSKPITMRELMTHTPGFEEVERDLFANERSLQPLGRFLRERLPDRIYPAGTIPAYSNYGAALAGYIVQRVSGEPFDTYVAHHIFTPLDMTHATFAQPLPPHFARWMSKGYRQASMPPLPYELINLYPAGSAAVSADDMTHFMLAHLNDGTYGQTRILQAATARMMYRAASTPVIGLPSMALGFIGAYSNGHALIWHGGDTMAFHSGLYLIPDANTGLFIAFNSAGANDGADTLRDAVFTAFMNRYFPSAVQSAGKFVGRKKDAAFVAGNYVLSRGSFTNLLTVSNFFGREVTIAGNPDGSISAPVLTSSDQTPKTWREIRPFLWREDNGDRLYGAKLADGRLAYLGEDDLAPIEVLLPTPFSLAPWNLPLLGAAIAMFALVVSFWPIKAVLRWRYARPFSLTGRAAWLYRGTRAVSVANLIFLGGFLALFVLGSDLLNAPPLWLFRLLQTAGVVGIAGIVLPIAELTALLANSGRPWWTKAAQGLTVLACLATIWLAFDLHLLSLSLLY
jgi:CubicO group peptidase (beta-lactamase class C family)